ncbi:MAG: pantoate--beta-alanine ligase [Candidatus Omnitrophica bacterium]|nr:pantoate--beta-alanine ligase [Candidatus Omnitrophota bacterium]
MRVVRRVRDMIQFAEQIRRRGETIGLVPTMGALHEGHLSLIRAARRQTDTVVVSIFVNPLQFGVREDFARYPRNLSRDLALAKREGADVVFAPSREEMYPRGACAIVEVEGLSDQLEGALRPGHFRGVATVVAKLFNIVQPTIAYFGQKDYQQAVIIKRMVEDLHWPVRIDVLPTVRESDGLAMSSRNVYLSTVERRQAVALSQALKAAHEAIRGGERRAQALRRRMQAVMRQQALIRVQQIGIVDAATLTPVAQLKGRAAILVAAFVGTTRLIDNLLVDVT